MRNLSLNKDSLRALASRYGGRVEVAGRVLTRCLASKPRVACIFTVTLAMASGCSETQEVQTDDAGLLDIAAEPRPAADVAPPDGSGETDRSATPDVAPDPDAPVSTDVATPRDGVGVDSIDSGVTVDGADARGSCPTDSIWETVTKACQSNPDASTSGACSSFCRELRW
jgi:hypothetical protein